MLTRCKHAFALALICLGAVLCANAAWVPLKAVLAQHLIARAWNQGGKSLPWYWADTWPVARLRIDSQGIDQYVLAGGQGNALAFGPSLVYSPPGIVVLAGHNDTHFQFLEALQSGTEISLQWAGAQRRTFTVIGAEILDSRTDYPRFESADLALITCYPFDALEPGGPMRYIVYAVN